MRKLALRTLSFCGRLLLGGALTLFLVALALFGVASYLVSLPYMRLYSRREAHLRVALDALTVISAVWQLAASAQARSAQGEQAAAQAAASTSGPPEAERDAPGR